MASSVSISRVLFQHHCCDDGICHLSTLWVAPQLKRSTLRRLCCRAGYPLPTVYANLQPPEDTARRSPGDWWSLTPPSHPYPRLWAVVFFCLYLLLPTASTFRSGVPFAARTFLSHDVPATEPRHCLPRAKLRKLF